MKARKFIWSILLVAAIFCSLSVLPAPPAPVRVRIENNVFDILGQSDAARCSDYDPYFIPQNSVARDFIGAGLRENPLRGEKI